MKIDKMMERVEDCGTKAMISYAKGCRSVAVVSFSFGMVLLIVLQAITYFMAVDAGFQNTNAIIVAAAPLAGPLFLAVQLLIVGEGIPVVLFVLSGCVAMTLSYAANRIDCYRLAVAATGSPIVAPVVRESLAIELTEPVNVPVEEHVEVVSEAVAVETAEEFDLESILAQTSHGKAAGISPGDKAVREEQVAEILEMLDRYSK